MPLGLYIVNANRARRRCGDGDGDGVRCCRTDPVVTSSSASGSPEKLPRPRTGSQVGTFGVAALLFLGRWDATTHPFHGPVRRSERAGGPLVPGLPAGPAHSNWQLKQVGLLQTRAGVGSV